MKWFRVIWSNREFTEENYTDLIFTSEDKILEDLADLQDVGRKTIVIKEIFAYKIQEGGLC